MKEYIIRLSVLLKKQFTNKLYICFLIIMPLCFLLAQFILAKSDDKNRVSAGYYIEVQNSDFSAVLRKSLKESSGILHFAEYDDPSAMLEDTAISKLECSYIFTEALFTGLLENDYKNTILSFSSPSTVVSDMVDEIIFTAVFRAFGDSALCVYIDENPDIFAQYNDTELKSALRAAYIRQLETGHTFSLDFKAYGDSSESQTVSSSQIPVHGIIAVFLFLCMLLACSDYCTELEQGTLNMLPPKKRCIISSCFLESWLLPAFVSSGITLIIASFGGNLSTSSEITSGTGIFFYEILALLVYFILLMISGLVLNLIIKKSLLISALIPVLITGSLIFCPVIISLSAILPIARVIEKLFLPYYYLVFF